MEVLKDLGFSAKNISTNYGINYIQIIGEGSNNPTANASVKINNNTPYASSASGLTLVIYDENLNIVSGNTYNIANSATDISNLNTALTTLPSRSFFILFSYDATQTNSTLTTTFNNLGSVLWATKFNYPATLSGGTIYNQRIPYAAIGTTDLGIVYEKLGDGRPGASEPNANLNVGIRSYDSFGAKGYGENLLPQTLYTYNETTNNTVSFPITTINTQQYVRLSYFVAILNKISTTDNLSTTIRIKENGTVLTSTEFTCTTNTFTKNEVYFTFNPSNTYTMEIDYVANADIVFKSVYLNKAGLNPTYTDNAKFAFYKNSDSIGCNNLQYSSNATDYYDANSLEVNYNSSIAVFTTNNTYYLGNKNLPSVNITSSITSDFISVSDQLDYVFSSWFYAATSDSVELSIEAFDNSQSPIQINDYYGNSFTTLSLYKVDINSTPSFKEVFLLSYLNNNASEYINDNMSTISNYGYMSPYNSSTSIPQQQLAILQQNTAFIKITLIGSNSQAIIPYLSRVKYAFKNDGTMLGKTNNY